MPENSARMGIEFSALFFGYFLLSKQKKVTKRKIEVTKEKELAPTKKK